MSSSTGVSKVVVQIEDADLSDVGLPDVTLNGLAKKSVSVSGDKVTITSSGSVSNGNNVKVEIDDVTNPSDAGRYDFSVTLKDSNGGTVDSWKKTYRIGNLNAQSQSRFWKGQQLYLHKAGGDGHSYELWTVNRDSDGEEILGSFQSTISFDNGNALIRTNDLDGSYAVVDGSGDVYKIDASGTIDKTSGDAPTTKDNDVEQRSFDVSTQTLTASFDANKVNKETSDLSLYSNRGDYWVNVSSNDLSDSDLKNEIFGSISNTIKDTSDDGILIHITGDGVLTADFSSVDTGDYSFNFNVKDTSASASDSITVEEEQDANAKIGNGGVISIPEGDVAVMPIRLENTDTATVNIGYDGNGYNLTLDISDNNDDGVVALKLNTYTMGRTSGVKSAVETASVQGIGTDDSSDDVSVVSVQTTHGAHNNQINDPPLDPAGYSVNVTDGGVDGKELAVGTLQITGDRVGQIQSWTAPSDSWSDIEQDTPSSMYDLVNSGSLTKSDKTAQNDVLVYQIQSTSWVGALEYADVASDGSDDDDYATALVKMAQNGYTAGSDDTALKGDYYFKVEQAGSTANKGAKKLNLGATNSNDGLKVVSDPVNGTMFVAIKANDAKLSRDSYGASMGSSLKFDSGEQYEANFTISEESNIVDKSKSIKDKATIKKRTLTYDTGSDGTIHVKAAKGQQITGRTSVAPGTELNLIIKSTGSNPFLENPQPTVAPDGTFTATVDFSKYSSNTSFSAYARGFDKSDVEVPGLIGEGRSAVVSMADQTLQGGAVDVSTTLSDGGFIVLHKGSADGDIVGSSDYISNSGQQTVSVSLDSDLASAQTLVAVAHVDSNGNQQFDAGTDNTYMNGSQPVQDSATISVSSGTTQGTTSQGTTSKSTTSQSTSQSTSKATEQKTTTSTGPGFTAGIAIIGLLGAALVALRRRD